MKSMKVRDMCLVLGVSKSAFYKWRKNPICARSRQEKMVLTPKIHKAFIDSRGTYGSARIDEVLRDMGITTSIRRIRRIMNQEKLVPRQIHRFRCTTKRGADTSKIPDLVNREFKATAPNKIWVADITEVPTVEGLVYLAFILDLFSRYVVGWSTAAHKKVSLVINALAMALERRQPPKGFVFHSDHGSQYGSNLFQSILRLNGGVASMGSVGDCYDNAVAESFVHTLKGECLNDTQLISRDFTERLIFDYIEVFYNRKRKHSSLGFVSPEEFEKKSSSVA